MPKARLLISTACFQPEMLKMLSSLFDELWASLAPEFDDDDAADARIRLAVIVFDLANDEPPGLHQSHKPLGGSFLRRVPRKPLEIEIPRSPNLHQGAHDLIRVASCQREASKREGPDRLPNGFDRLLRRDLRRGQKTPRPLASH